MIESTTNNTSSNLQLWQFLLELLIDKNYSTIIEWKINNNNNNNNKNSEGENENDDGVFEILDSTELARLWGARKGNAQMTFSTLSRTLRNYQTSGIISKLSSDRSQYIYKFSLDLKMYAGYSSKELLNLKNTQNT